MDQLCLFSSLPRLLINFHFTERRRGFFMFEKGKMLSDNKLIREVIAKLPKIPSPLAGEG
jgi:hypothetical protein